MVVWVGNPGICGVKFHPKKAGMMEKLKKHKSRMMELVNGDRAGRARVEGMQFQDLEEEGSSLLSSFLATIIA